jgi:hypothetical protein
VKEEENVGVGCCGLEPLKELEQLEPHVETKSYFGVFVKGCLLPFDTSTKDATLAEGDDKS